MKYLSLDHTHRGSHFYVSLSQALEAPTNVSCFYWVGTTQDITSYLFFTEGH